LLFVSIAYLHLRSPILEPELDLPGFEAEPLAQLGALLLVWVGAFLEHPAPMSQYPCMSQSKQPSTGECNESLFVGGGALTLPALGSAAACGGGTASPRLRASSSSSSADAAMGRGNHLPTAAAVPACHRVRLRQTEPTKEKTRLSESLDRITTKKKKETKTPQHVSEEGARTSARESAGDDVKTPGPAPENGNCMPAGTTPSPK
jgi:hypothetical protein